MHDRFHELSCLLQQCGCKAWILECVKDKVACPLRSLCNPVSPFVLVAAPSALSFMSAYLLLALFLFVECVQVLGPRNPCIRHNKHISSDIPDSRNLPEFSFPDARLLVLELSARIRYMCEGPCDEARERQGVKKRRILTGKD